jgi:uncharacterized protein (TIGR02246 family)
MAQDLLFGFVSAWNARDAAALGALFTDDATLVGFDGTVVTGADAIQSHLGAVFADHVPGRYVALVRETRSLGSSGAVLVRADLGMTPPGASDLDERVTARQVLVAVDGRIALLATTPAALHGRPEELTALTDELRQAGSTSGS